MTKKIDDQDSESRLSIPFICLLEGDMFRDRKDYSAYKSIRCLLSKVILGTHGDFAEKMGQRRWQNENLSVNKLQERLGVSHQH